MKLTYLLMAAAFVPWAQALMHGSSAGASEDDGPKTPELCLERGNPCMNEHDQCCGAYVCLGPAQNKTCEEPPMCLAEGYACAGSKTRCCETLECISTHDIAVPQCQPKLYGSHANALSFPARSLEDGRQLTKNTYTTKIPGAPVHKNIACSTGDPHILTFDGLKYDCHAEGDFVLAKSNYTAREIQARFQHVAWNKAASITTGVAIQDEGDTPRVEVSIPFYNNSVGKEMYDGCKLQLFVDGVQRHFEDGSGQDDKVEVISKDNDVWVKYVESEMVVKIRYFQCHVSVCVHLPDTDHTVGVLGTATNTTHDDWTISNGTQLEVPESLVDRLRKPAYDFCSKHFCIRDEVQSLFTYPEAAQGLDFDYYQKCDLPFGSTIEDYIFGAPQEMMDVCQGDLQCLIDVMTTGEVGASELHTSLSEYADTCNPPGGECDESSCCDGNCVDFGGFAGKICGGNSTCTPEYGSCDSEGCCDGLTCTDFGFETKVCVVDSECSNEYMSCSVDTECCDEMKCLDDQRGGKVCRRLPFCAANWDDCSLVGCCGDLLCVDNGLGGKQCRGIPDCWYKENEDCSNAPCCDPLTCIEEDDGRKLCKDLLGFAELGESCKWVPCDEDEPLECIPVFEESDGLVTNEVVDMKCRLVPGEAEIFVFSDLNSNGIQDSNEPGIAGVKLRIIHHATGHFVTEVDGGNAHEEATTDSQGLARVTGVPKGTLLSVKVTSPPPGAIRTLNNKGSDDEVDSDLLPHGGTNPFHIEKEDIWTRTDLGYRMPTDVMIRVFDDLNSNGIQDEGELGIQGVSMVLTDPQEERLQPLGNNSTAHLEVTTDRQGVATFRKVPQGMKLRAKVTRSPGGALHTTPRHGNDKTIDSDLRSDGTSYQFMLKTASNYTSLDLGYRMPGTVTVRVWNDVSANGIQEHGEPGIKGVRLRLVTDKGKYNLPDNGNGGTAHMELTTDADGLVHFTEVPQGQRLNVKVVERPNGSMPTFNKRGSDAGRDSNIRSSGYSDAFKLEASGTPFSEIDLGYRLPATMIVRVWDDANGDGVQDDNESGIKGVELQLISSSTHLNVTSPTFTDSWGYATFPDAPRDSKLLVEVINAPKGALRTRQHAGNDDERDSDLGPNGLSGPPFIFSGTKALTHVDLGYQMPRDMVVRVWDDRNNNGIQDGGELGIEDVKLRLVQDSNMLTYMGECDGGSELCPFEFSTNSSGLVTFSKVPKGTLFRVMVVNAPKGARRATQSKGNKDNDSDLEGNGLTEPFNLANFVGSTFDEIDIGYSMPDEVEVRVWDDVNHNGIQDIGELGIEGVELRIIKAGGGEGIDDQLNGGNAHQVLVTNDQGIALFTKVPVGEHLRVEVMNPPNGALRTSMHAPVPSSDTVPIGYGKDDLDSDLRSDGTTVSFNLASFSGDRLGKIDIGYQMPKDVEVRVWEDVNGNGVQDPGEPGIAGVELRLLDSKTGAWLENIGGGSNAHQGLVSDVNGIVLFRKAPKGRKMRVKVMNAPVGSLRTSHNRGSSDLLDSDLRDDMTSDVFNLNSFKGEVAAYGKIDLGFRMPKDMVVRVWNDVNQNGIQDEGEDGIKNVRLRLVDYITLEGLSDNGSGGTFFKLVKTDALGRATFTNVPQGVRLRVEVVRPPENAVATLRNAGTDDELDSELNPSGISDSFQLPSDVTSLFTKVDLGYMLQNCVCETPEVESTDILV